MGRMRIRKGDTVKVIAGRDLGKQGRVLRVLQSKGMVVVEGVNRAKKHTRANPQKGQQGGIVEREMPMNASNVMLVIGGKPARHNKRAA